MVKDKNLFGVQLQNQKLDIKRLISLQSIQASKALTESSPLKAQLDERSRLTFSFQKATAVEPSLRIAAERRMSSFFAINQLSDELAQVSIRSPNIENIEPSVSRQVEEAPMMLKSTPAEKNADLGKVIGESQETECAASGHVSVVSMIGMEHENGKQTGKVKSQTPRHPVRGALLEASLQKQNSMHACDEGAQGKCSRPRSQVNYKEARSFAKCVKICLLELI